MLLARGTLGAWSLFREPKACTKSFLPKFQVFSKYEPEDGDVDGLMYCGYTAGDDYWERHCRFPACRFYLLRHAHMSQVQSYSLEFGTSKGRGVGGEHVSYE